MSSAEKVMVHDSQKTPINPATEENQQSSIDKLSQIISDLGELLPEVYPNQHDQPLTRGQLDSGVDVNNLPENYPLPPNQLDTLTPPESPLDYPDEGNHERLDAVTGECRTGEKAIKVFQCPSPEDNGTKFFFNDEYGVNMNQNGVASSSLVESDFIHGGGAGGEAPVGETAWQAVQISGSGANFNATQLLFDPPPQSGTFYHDLRSCTDESVWQFRADQAVPSSTHLEFYLYIQRWENQSSRQIELRLKNNVTEIGFAQLRDYIDRTGSINQWQLVRIPLEDFSPTGTWDRIEFTLKHQRVDVCTDSIRLLNTAVELEDIVFELAPDDGDKLIIDTLRFSFVDQVTTNPTTGLPNVDYNAIGAIPALANGLLYQRIADGGVITSFAVRRLWDLMRVPATTLETHIGGAIGNQVMYLVTSTFARPLILDSANGDKLSYTIRDDLSGLLELNVSVGAGRLPSA